MKKSFIVSYYFILQLCCISCFAMDLPKPIQNSIISIHDNNHPNAILGRKFIHSFMYKSLQNAKNDFDALEASVQKIVWSYLNNITQSDQNNNIDTITGPALLATVLKLPIEIIYEIFHQYDKNKNFSIAQYLTDHISIVKEVEALYGKRTIKKLCCSYYYDISIPISKQDALDARLTREQWTTLQQMGKTLSKKQLQTLASVEDSIIKIIVDEYNKHNIKKECYIRYSYQETLSRMLFVSLKSAVTNCLFSITLPLMYHYYITDHILSSCPKFQDQSLLNAYNEAKNIANEIDALKSWLTSMNRAFKNEYFKIPHLPDVPFYYHPSTHLKILLSILPSSLPAPLLSIIRTYCNKTLPDDIADLCGRYLFHLLLNKIFLAPISYEFKCPELCLTISAAFFVFFMFYHLTSKYLSHPILTSTIDVSAVKPLKKFLTELLEDDGIIIQ